MNQFPDQCARCSADLGKTSSIMSKFNLDTLCKSCKERERAHPGYAEADRLECEAVLRGERNFPGIGAPPELYRPPCKAEEFLLSVRLLAKGEVQVVPPLPDDALHIAFPDHSRAAILPGGTIRVTSYA